MMADVSKELLGVWRLLSIQLKTVDAQEPSIFSGCTPVVA